MKIIRRRIGSAGVKGQRRVTVYRVDLIVQCYAGRKADERPVRFQLGDQEYLVDEILDQWYGPDDHFFKVRADDGNLYILRHNEAVNTWSLESFRRQ